MKVQVGSYISLDFERILSLKPDLIIATGAGNTREMVERLEKFGLPTYVIFPEEFGGYPPEYRPYRPNRGSKTRGLRGSSRE